MLQIYTKDKNIKSKQTKSQQIKKQQLFTHGLMHKSQKLNMSLWNIKKYITNFIASDNEGLKNKKVTKILTFKQINIQKLYTEYGISAL